MHKYVLLVLLIGSLMSCQKGNDTDIDPQPPISDTIASVVVDGDYGGYATTDYDSAVLQYASGLVTIKHFNRSTELVATETIRYDPTGRVSTYLMTEPLGSYRVARSFGYQDVDLAPSAIDDTVVTDNNTEISRLRFTERNITSTTKTFRFSHSFKFVNNSTFDHTISTSSSFHSDWRLLSHEVPDNYVSTYHYNTSSDIDSASSTTLSGDDSYAAIRYSAVDNPLYAFSKLVFKNLSPYMIVDNLNNSDYEQLLDISFFPSELLTSKIPSRSNTGTNAHELYSENTFTYSMDNGELKQIVVTHKELDSGTGSQTTIRFYRP